MSWARALGAHLPFYHPKLRERILDLFIEGGALRSEAAGFCSSSLYFMERISPEVLARVGEITKETMRGRSN